MCADKAKHQPSEKHTLDEVLKTLQDLVRNELADETATPSSKSSRRTKKDAQPPRDERADETAQIPPPEEEATAINDLEAHAELSPESFALAPQPSTVVEAPAPIEAPQDAQTRSGKKKKGPPPEQTSINWDDVPVLNDVVELSTGAEGARALLPTSDTNDNVALAAPEKAREIAVRAVAKLNIELRKAGNPPLDPVIIDRLEQLLRDALVAAQPKT